MFFTYYKTVYSYIYKIANYNYKSKASQVALVVKKPSATAGDNRCRFDPWVRTIAERRARQPIPVSLPGESQRQRSLTGYSPSIGSQRIRHNRSD